MSTGDDVVKAMESAVPIGQAILSLVGALVPIAAKAFTGASTEEVLADATAAFAEWDRTMLGFAAQIAKNDQEADDLAKTQKDPQP